MLGKKLLLVLAVVLVFGFVSCDNGTTKDTYYVALYEITEATFDGLNMSLAAVDALTWVRAQPGTGSAPAISRSGYSFEEVQDFLRNYIGFPENDVNIVSSNIRQMGYSYSRYQTNTGYRFLYIIKE